MRAYEELSGNDVCDIDVLDMCTVRSLVLPLLSGADALWKELLNHDHYHG